MYDSFYQLKRCNQSKRACLIPQSIFYDWKMKRSLPHSISFGTKMKYCQFFGHQKEDEILLSNDIWEELCIPFEKDIHIIVNDRTLYLGPLIGIFTAAFAPTDKQFNMPHEKIFNLISTEQQQGISPVKKQDQVVVYRVHLNKDGNGNWHITSIIGRTNQKLLIDYALFLAKNSITNPETFFPSISLERKRGS